MILFCYDIKLTDLIRPMGELSRLQKCLVLFFRTSFKNFLEKRLCVKFLS